MLPLYNYYRKLICYCILITNQSLFRRLIIRGHQSQHQPLGLKDLLIAAHVDGFGFTHVTQFHGFRRAGGNFGHGDVFKRFAHVIL